MSNGKRKEPREIHQSVGVRLKYFRERKKFSLHDLERKTGISASYLNRLENGYRKAPSFPILQLIADSLEVPLFELLNFPKPSEVLQSVGEMLLMNDYKVNGRIASSKLKNALTELVDIVLNADFDAAWNQAAFNIIDKAQTVIKLEEED